jgi:hypothetical protein
MKITFLSVNCSYSHTSMAYHLLKGYADPDSNNDWDMVECSINEKVDRVLRRLLATEPEMLLASCYIFNHTELFEILKRFTLLRPQTQIILGGPEFLGNNEAILREFPWINLIVRGEGEIPFRAVLAGRKWSFIKGLCWIDEESRYRDNNSAELADMAQIIPLYSRLFNESRPFVQYETSRGCPNRCNFCTSSLDPVLRYLPLEVVREHLQHVARTGIQEVRILDRTFNSKNSRAIELVRMFREEFPTLRFHCEVDPAFIQDSLFDELALAPPGQLHLETGLQTFSQETYDIVNRISPMDKTVSGLTRLCKMENLEVHADLIGGLPGCTKESQYADLMRLFPMQPSEIQLENLKILPGLPLSQVEGLLYSPTPPYEVLKTATMSYEDLCQITHWSRMLDWFYNYHPLQETLLACCLNDFNFFANFRTYLDSLSHFDSLLSPQNRFKAFHSYLESLNHKTGLMLLAKAWFLAGFSPERGIFPSSLFRDELDYSSLNLLGGTSVTNWQRRFHYSSDLFTLYIEYGKGCINSRDTEVAVWSLA